MQLLSFPHQNHYFQKISRSWFKKVHFILYNNYLKNEIDCFSFFFSCWVSFTNSLIWTFVTPVLVVSLVSDVSNV